MGRSGQPGAGEESPGTTEGPGGILLFYFQPCFLRYKGLQIRCTSEAYLCEYLAAYPNRTKTFKPSEVHPSKALSSHVTVRLPAAAARSLPPPGARLCPPASHVPSPGGFAVLSMVTSLAPCHFSDGLCIACRSGRPGLLHGLQPASIPMGCISAAVSQPVVSIPHIRSHLRYGHSHNQSRAH